MRRDRVALVSAVLALAASVIGPGVVHAQAAAPSRPSIDLIELVSFFLLPEASGRTAGDWYLASGPASPIEWTPHEVRWDERRQTFVRDGSAIVTLDGGPIHAAGSAEPVRWPIRLFGPREGFTRVAIASRVAAPDLSLDLPAQFASRGITYEARRCDAADAASGNRLFEIGWSGYERAWAHHQWACRDGSCAAYLSVSLAEPDPATLAAMPSTDCGVATTAGVAGEDGPALLFSAGSGDLTVEEQAEIFSGLGLAVAPDGAGLVDTACGQPASANVQFIDLNQDGVSEVLVVFGNTCTSGMAGSSVRLFIKRDGAYRYQLGFPGASAEPLETGNAGYPDLRIGLPGFCFPVWRWNGTEYTYHRDEAQAAGGCSGGS